MNEPATRMGRFDGGRVETWISRALFLLAAGMLLFFMAVTYRSLFHSDAAMKLLLGEEMARQFTLFPHDWNYVNDILIIFPTLFAAPLSLLFPPSLPLHATVDALAAACVLYSAYFASRAVGIDGPLRLFLPTALATGLSPHFSEAVFGQSAYSGTVFILLMLAAWTSRQLVLSRDSDSTPSRLPRIGIAILIAAGVAGGPRGLATYTAPLLLALVGFYFFAAADGGASQRTVRDLVFTVLAASFFGGMTFFILLSRVSYHSGAANQLFADDNQILHNVQLFANNWLVLFDALAPPGSRFGGVAAAIYVSRLGVAIFVFLLPLMLLTRLGSLASPALRFVVLFHIALVATTGYVLLFSTIQGSGPYGTPRYLAPCAATGLLVLACWLHEIGRSRKIETPWLGFVVIAALLSLAPFHLVTPAFRDWRNPSAGMRSNPLANVVAALDHAGLKRGYATYWNAGTITIQSANEVRVAPVTLSPGGLPVPYHHLSSEHWYDPEWADGRSFLLISDSESADLNRPTLHRLAGEPSETLKVDRFEILVYPFNIGERLGYSAQPYVRLPAMTAQNCAANYEPLESSLVLKPGEFGSVQVKATNRSPIVWSQNSTPFLNPGLRLLDAQGKQVSESRALLPKAVEPGASTVLTLPFRAPGPGEYGLLVSFVAEGEAWCGNRASNWAKIPLSVKP